MRQICDRYDILLILDEVQSGFGRTGKWFAFENFDVLPDIITIAKGLASGMPLSGVIAPMRLMEKWTPGSHGGTYGGNAVSAAAAVATIQTIREENLLENARLRGAQLMNGLRCLQEKYPQLADVRGLGLMVGCEFRDRDRQPDKNTAKAVVRSCFDNRFMLLTCGPWDNTVRWIPPLIVSAEQIQSALDIFDSALRRSVGP